MILNRSYPLNILVSCDKNYLKPLKTMLYSLFVTNKADIDIYLLHKSIDKTSIEELSKFIDEKSNKKSKL